MLLEPPLLGALGEASSDFLYVQGRYLETSHQGQVVVKRSAFRISNTLPIPMGCRQLEGWQAFPLGVMGDGLQSWGDSPKKIRKSCPRSCCHWTPSSSTYVEGNQPI
jgi:hypothetical protein